ncbi:10010_t:CDS:2, partial [Rhizophagus irregularis]
KFSRGNNTTETENEQARKARELKEENKDSSQRKLATKSCKQGKIQTIDLLKRQDVFIKRSTPLSDDETPNEQKRKRLK